MGLDLALNSLPTGTYAAGPVPDLRNWTFERLPRLYDHCDFTCFDVLPKTFNITIKLLRRSSRIATLLPNRHPTLLDFCTT